MLGSERLSEQDRIEGMRMIGRPAEAQQHLIGDLLDVSRMSSGQLRLNVRLARLTDVVSSAVESVRPSAEARKVQIEADLSEAVGMLRVDAERTRRGLRYSPDQTFRHGCPAPLVASDTLMVTSVRAVAPTPFALRFAQRHEIALLVPVHVAPAFLVARRRQSACAFRPGFAGIAATGRR